MNNDLTILVDADDVIENLAERWVEVLNHLTGSSLREQDITEWDITKFYPQLRKEEVYKVLEKESFWDGLKATPGAYEAIVSLAEDGHIIKIVTASHYSTLQYKIPKIMDLFPCLEWQDFIITSEKQFVKGDIIIDDNPINLRGERRYKLLFDRPHNQKFDAEKNNVFRMKNWAEIRALIMLDRKYFGGQK